MDVAAPFSKLAAFSRVAPLVFLTLAFALPAYAESVFKCGSTFQDRPCESRDIQQRYSRVAGGFSIEQVNPDTDADCARIAATALPYWQRLSRGDGYDALKAEIDARPISREEKSLMRDVLIALREYKGTAAQVRSRLESQCMSYKRRHGVPTEREIAAGGASLASESQWPGPVERRGYESSQGAALASEMRARAEARRAEAAAARAAAAARR